MKYFHRNKIHFNYREVQSLNNRTLYTNVPTKSSELYARTNVENTANVKKAFEYLAFNLIELLKKSLSILDTQIKSS